MLHPLASIPRVLPFLLVLALVAPAQAQLSGEFSVGPGGDFGSPAEAVAALEEEGVEGPTVFRVDGGVYEGQLTIPAIAGASASNRITFWGKSTNRPVLEYRATGSSDNWVVKLNRADYVTFDGFVITPVGDLHAVGMLVSYADEVVIRNSVFQQPKLSTASVGSQNSMYVINSGDITIEGNEFRTPTEAPDNSSAALRLIGSQSLRPTIRHNTFEERGQTILLSSAVDVAIEGNTSAGSVRLLYVTGATVVGNEIHGGALEAFFAIGVTGTSEAPVQVVGNIMSSSHPFVANIKTGSSFVRFIHNTLYMNSSGSVSGLLGVDNSSNVTVERNLFHTETAGIGVYYSSTVSIASSNHNVFSQSVPGIIARVGSTGFTTMESYRSATGFGASSSLLEGAASATFADPARFDFHLAGASDGDRALLVPQDPAVEKDIDGQSRPFATYVGADEATSFAPLAGTYQVYGPGASFATLQRAIDEISLLGMSGPVTFDLVQPSSGGAHDVHVRIPAIPGATATNRLTISGRVLESPVAHNAVSETDNWIVRLDSTAHVTFVGLWFRTDLGVDDDYDRAVWLDGAVEDIEFVLCRFSGDTEADGGSGVQEELVYGEGAAQDVRFQLNEFVGGAHGVYHSGDSFTSRASGFEFVATGGGVAGNTFTDQSESAIYLQNHLAPSIVDIVSTSGEDGTGIFLVSGRGGRIERAVVQLDGAFGSGLLVVSWSSGVDGGLEVANSSFDAPTRGAFVRNSGGVELRHNTFRTTGAGFAALEVETAFPVSGDVTAVHNLLVSDGQEPAVVTDDGNLQSTANNLYTNGPALARVDGTDYATLAAYQSATGQEGGSVSVPVTFAAAGAPALAGASIGDDRLGVARLPDVLTDFEGDSRMAFTYLGADEADTPLSQAAFAVSNPIDGDLYAWGDPINVRWTTLDPAVTAADRVRISLVCTGQAPIVRFASAANTGAKGFLMPASVGTHGGPADPGGACQAEVALETDPSKRGLSAPFATQDPARDVEVTEPDRFSRYGIGDPFTFRWDAADVDAAAPGSTVDLSILCPGRADYVAFTNRPNNGARGFLLPTDFGAYDGCHAQVAATADGTVFGRSQGFEVRDVPLPSVEVTAPTAATTWPAGTTQDVTWTTNSTDPTVEFRILLDRPGLAAPVRLAQTENDGLFEWAIPAGQPTGGGYRIRLTGLAQDGSRVRDVSELFSISAAAPDQARVASATPLGRGWTRVEPGSVTDVGAWLAPLAADGRRIVARDDAGRMLVVTEAGVVGTLHVADGAIDVWVDGPATLGAAPPASGERRADPAHFAFAATDALARPAALWTVTAPGLSDGDEVAVVTEDGTVVGRGVVSGGTATLVVVGSESDLDDEAPEVLLDAEPQSLGLRAWRRATGEEVDLAVETMPAGAEALAFVSGAEWEVQTAAVPALAVAAEAPDGLTLEPVSPNPARGTARVRVGVPEVGRVVATVYDVRGRVVATLSDGERPAGWLDLDLDAGSLAAGVYVVRVQTGTEQATRTMTVVR